jgi:NAD(P)-dependent dehydrogenase (short-subunit alcohol dehydrogenase family)
VRGVPLGRLGQPLDVARACLFFASELSDFITGEVMDVNGGMHID